MKKCLRSIGLITASILLAASLGGLGCSSSSNASTAKAAKVTKTSTSLKISDALDFNLQTAVDCSRQSEDQYVASIVEKIDGQERIFQVIVPKFKGPGVYKTGKGIGPASVSLADSAMDGVSWSTTYNDASFEIVIDEGEMSGAITSAVLKTSPNDKTHPASSVSISGQWLCKSK